MTSKRFEGREEKEVLSYIEGEVRTRREEALRQIEEFGPKGSGAALDRFIMYDLWLQFHEAAQKDARNDTSPPQEKPIVTDRGRQWPFKK